VSVYLKNIWISLFGELMRIWIGVSVYLKTTQILVSRVGVYLLVSGVCVYLSVARVGVYLRTVWIRVSVKLRTLRISVSGANV